MLGLHLGHPVGTLLCCRHRARRDQAVDPRRSEGFIDHLGGWRGSGLHGSVVTSGRGDERGGAETANQAGHGSSIVGETSWYHEDSADLLEGSGPGCDKQGLFCDITQPLDWL